MKSLTTVNVLLVIGLVIFAMFLYGREQQTRMAEREIRRIRAEIAREEESMRLLRIEWAMLNSPMRLERLAARHLDLRPVDPERIRPVGGVLADVPRRKPDSPAAGARSLDELIARIQKEEAAR